MSTKVTEKRFPSRENVYDEASFLLKELSQIMCTEMQFLHQSLGLLNQLNRRCFRIHPESGTSKASNKVSLVVVRLRTMIIRGEEQDGIVEHVLRADHVLGLSRGEVAVGNKVLSIPYAIPSFGFALAEQPTQRITGAIQWVKPGKSNRLGYSHRMWHEDQRWIAFLLLY